MGGLWRVENDFVQVLDFADVINNDEIIIDVLLFLIFWPMNK